MAAVLPAGQITLAHSNLNDFITNSNECSVGGWAINQTAFLQRQFSNFVEIVSLRAGEDHIAEVGGQVVCAAPLIS